MKVKKNDTVLVLTGKDAGKTGKVMTAMPVDNKIMVDGVNVQKKSRKARNANETSGIVSQIGAIDASNVLVVCPACNKATRVAYKIVDGKKIRVCKKCGATLDAEVKSKKAAATAKKAPAKKAAKADDNATPKKAEKSESATVKKTATKKKAAVKEDKAE